tara:strand:- start:190 stop:990 length:801 start_codon:yes stop_codon:yes gene_type:complete
MLTSTPFYNESIKKCVAAFGTLFNDISIERVSSSGSKEVVKVPLVYSPKDKWRNRNAVTLAGQNQYEGAEVQISAPRMGFEYTGIEYDPSRKLNTVQKIATVVENDNTKLNRRFMRIPYNISFGLYLFVTRAEDGLKVIEQILPYFTPQFTITINDVLKTDITLTLNSTSFEDSWEGDMDARRRIEWSLDFTAKTYLYGPVSEQSIVKKPIIHFYDHVSPNTKENPTSSTLVNAASRAVVGTNPTNADPNDSFTETITITYNPGAM